MRYYYDIIGIRYCLLNSIMSKIIHQFVSWPISVARRRAQRSHAPQNFLDRIKVGFQVIFK